MRLLGQVGITEGLCGGSDVGGATKRLQVTNPVVVELCCKFQ